MADELNQSEFNTADYSAASAPESQRFNQKRKPPNRFDNSPQSCHNHLQMIILLQIDVHILRYDSKNYKKIKLRSDWSLFCTVSDYKIDFINENKVWIKVQLKNMSLEQSVLINKWVYKTKWN